jgi:uncharacterized protein (UPF0264 family)
MQLLVSVRSAAEVEPALRGGAHIIDAKEPDRGSLGPVTPRTLAAILALVPSRCPFSVALGDVGNPEGVLAAIESIELPSRSAPTYLKLGFAGVRSPDAVTGMLAAAVAALARKGSDAIVVAVGYADAAQAGSIAPDLIPRCARQGGAGGVLLDTHAKDGNGLLHWCPPPALADWVVHAGREGLLTAVAGALEPADIAAVAAARPDVVGVRGAACEGGRQGRISSARVRDLRHHLDLSGLSFPAEIPAARPGVGETRDRAADGPGDIGLSHSKPMIRGASQGA